VTKKTKQAQHQVNAANVALSDPGLEAARVHLRAMLVDLHRLDRSGHAGLAALDAQQSDPSTSTEGGRMCTPCDGTGHRDRCDVCEGRGWLMRDDHPVRCSGPCAGTGKHHRLCVSCGGAGLVLVDLATGDDADDKVDRDSLRFKRMRVIRNASAARAAVAALADDLEGCAPRVSSELEQEQTFDCVNCRRATIGNVVGGVPVSSPVAQEYAGSGLCRWCGRFLVKWGVLPIAQMCARHARGGEGGNVTQRQRLRAFADVPAFRQRVAERAENGDIDAIAELEALAPYTARLVKETAPLGVVERTVWHEGETTTEEVG
jgi:hypothetical protein